tara:strand:- start:2432 stop:3163 length:732 start_codon:yes stop_codon:yes gene_type:complete
MKALILAGGKGTRFLEETNLRPKPMIEINGKPMLLHIIEQYIRYDIFEFIVLGGYKIEVIHNYFKNQKLNDIGDYFYQDKSVTIKVLDTGLETQTGGRIKRAKDYLSDTFLLTYGDGLANVNISESIEFHLKQNKLATVTAVRPPARFGSLTIDGDSVISFGEKISTNEGWINGGFFVLNKEILNFIDSDETIFEKKPLESLSSSNNLSAFKHNGFFYPVDTIREKEIVENLILNNKLSWIND